eukprot:4534604-Prymnesium_polylepis.1
MSFLCVFVCGVRLHVRQEAALAANCLWSSGALEQAPKRTPGFRQVEAPAKLGRRPCGKCSVRAPSPARDTHNRSQPPPEASSAAADADIWSTAILRATLTALAGTGLRRTRPRAAERGTCRRLADRRLAATSGALLQVSSPAHLDASTVLPFRTRAPSCARAAARRHVGGRSRGGGARQWRDDRGDGGRRRRQRTRPRSCAISSMRHRRHAPRSTRTFAHQRRVATSQPP